MKKFITVLIGSFLPLIMVAQITINNTGFTVNQLVNGVLVPATSGTTVSNVNYRGVYNVSSRYQIGHFTTAGPTATAMGFASGIVLSTGNTADIPLTLGTNPGSVAQMSRNYTSGTTGEIRSSNAAAGQDADLNILIAPQNYYNGVVLEFDFVPLTSTVQFRYIFGSEEYDDQSGSAFAINYNCSSYNDRFAMLLSGPGISGGQGYSNDAKNIARLSNNSIVGINSVNDGLVGSSGGAPNSANCLGANPAWLNGSPTTEFLGFINGTELNGNTRILTAIQSGLVAGQTYHLRIILADSNDGAYDSTVYLEASSFTTEVTALPVELLDFSGECVEEKGIELNWKTESERLNDYFLLYRASDENPEFVCIDTLKGQGSTSQVTSYTTVDKLADQGDNYYKLVQVDFDGRKEELKTIALNASCYIENPSEYMVSFNNESNSFQIEYSINHDRTVQFAVYDMIGQLISVEQIELDAQQTKTTVTLAKSLASGSYVVKIQHNNEVFSSMIVK
jgi:hypothetical protein